MHVHQVQLQLDTTLLKKEHEELQNRLEQRLGENNNTFK